MCILSLIEETTRLNVGGEGSKKCSLYWHVCLCWYGTGNANVNGMREICWFFSRKSLFRDFSVDFQFCLKCSLYEIGCILLHGFGCDINLMCMVRLVRHFLSNLKSFRIRVPASDSSLYTHTKKGSFNIIFISTLSYQFCAVFYIGTSLLSRVIEKKKKSSLTI